MSPAPALSHHRGADERHAHFADDDHDNHAEKQHDPHSKETAAASKKNKTPTSRTVFLGEEDDGEDSEGARGEKKEVTTRTEAGDDSESDDDDDDDDEDARLRSHAFQRHHASKSPHKSAGTKGKGKGGVVVKRFDEYSDFLTRSERSRRDKQSKPADVPATGSKVNWHSSLEASVKVLPEINDDDASSLYMTRDAWERIDMDLELTKKRWDNHVAGLIAFDFLHNTIRGMELMLDEIGARKRDSFMSQHVKAVLNEQNRQRVHHEFFHAAKMRKVAEQTSLQEEATQRGQADAEEAINIWLGKSSEAHRPAGAAPAPTSGAKSNNKSGSGKKKKNGGGFNLLSMFQGKHKK
jgi:hypothetical protein